MERYGRISARPAGQSRRLGLREHRVRTGLLRTRHRSLSGSLNLTCPVRSGLGLLEFLEFFEDVGMEPIMAVWSGEYIFRQNTISSLSLRMRLAGRTRLRARRN